MLAIDIRECNKLEKNAKRLEKALELVNMVAEAGIELDNLDLRFVMKKINEAQEKLLSVRSSIIKSNDQGRTS